MKKNSFLFIVLISISSFTYGQQIISGVKNFSVLKKGSSALPQTRFKTGEIVMMKNSDDGMNIDIIKNGKTIALIPPCVDCIFGQSAEMDIDGNGKTEVLIGTRLTAETFEVKIYHKDEFDVEYKLFITLNGQNHCEFPGDNTVKIFTTDLKVAHLKFKPDGTWVVLEQ